MDGSGRWRMCWGCGSIDCRGKAGRATRGITDVWLAGKSKVDWSEAMEHLSRVDPKLGAVIERTGPCTLKTRGDCFISLCRAIISQQISGVVAVAITKRFKKLFPRSRPTPKHLLTLSDEQLRSAGLSRQKMSYLKDLAAHF